MFFCFSLNAFSQVKKDFYVKAEEKDKQILILVKKAIRINKEKEAEKTKPKIIYKTKYVQNEKEKDSIKKLILIINETNKKNDSLNIEIDKSLSQKKRKTFFKRLFSKNKKNE